jgi:hypothetical protein
MLALLSAVVASCCVLASARRMAWAVAPVSLDAGVLLSVLQGDGAKARWETLRRTLMTAPEATWERDLAMALAESDPRAREAQVVQQLLELDWCAQKWARVPRVCASIATSAGFFFGSIALLRGMGMPEDGPGPPGGQALIAALDALTVGVAATSFCVAVHLRTRQVVRQRLAAEERLVGRLQGLAEDGESGDGDPQSLALVYAPGSPS